MLQFDVEPLLGTEAPLQVSDSGRVLINSSCHPHDPERSISELCIYIVDGEPVAPTQEHLLDCLINTIEARDFYHTTQDNGTSNLNNLEDVPWNLKKTYAICSDLHEPLRFLFTIGSKVRDYRIPIMQGSLRASAESGSYQFARNCIPWQDWRRVGSRKNARMFILYKIITSEAMYWKTIAAQLRAKGTACCRICATPIEGGEGGQSTYYECIIALKNYDGPGWVTDIMQGISLLPESYEESDGYDSDGIPNFRDQWKELLAGYPSLGKRF